MHETIPPATPAQRWVVGSAVVLLGLTALAVLGVLARASGWSLTAGAGDGPLAEKALWAVVGLLFLLWNALPVVACAAAVVLVRRTWPLGLAAAVVAALLVAVLTTGALHDVMTSDSSTAALIFIFLPLRLWLVVGAGTGAAALLHTVRERRVHRRPRP